MKKKYSLLFFLAVIILVETGWKKSPEVETYLVSSKSFLLTVNVLGELDAAKSILISSSIRGDDGKIIYIIKDGTFVKKGDILVRLDPTPFENKIEELSGKREEAEALLEASRQMLEWEKVQGDNELKTAEFEMRAAELDLIRLKMGEGPLEMARLESASWKARSESDMKSGYVKDLEELKKEGFVNTAEIMQAKKQAEEARTAYEMIDRQYTSYRDYVLPSLLESAKAKVSQTKMKIEQTKKGIGIKIGKAMADLAQTEKKLDSINIALKKAKQELELTIIKAPLPGMAVLYESYHETQNRKPHVGDKVVQNQPLVYLPDISEMVVKTKVREVDLHKISVDKPASILVDAYPGLNLQGKVESIGILAESRMLAYGKGEKYFQAKVLVNDKDKRLRPGMTARVEIQCVDINNKLCVPIFAVFTEQGNRYCYVNKFDGFKKVNVEVGIQNEQWAVILSGLSEGDKVALVHPY